MELISNALCRACQMWNNIGMCFYRKKKAVAVCRCTVYPVELICHVVCLSTPVLTSGCCRLLVSGDRLSQESIVN